MSPLVDSIRGIYDRFAPDQIHPYVGASFGRADDGVLRVMGVGINAYVSERDWPKRSPGWFASWFTPPRDRYQRGAIRDLTKLAAAVTTSTSLFSAKRFAKPDSLYVTNAVKVYVPEATGKRAAQLTDADFDRHTAQWHDELDAMAEHGVLPHVIAIIGDPFWGRACDSFRTSSFARMKTKHYEWCKGSCLHYANRITLDAGGIEHTLLLVRLRHPASRRATGSPKWLSQQAEFAGLMAPREGAPRG